MTTSSISLVFFLVRMGILAGIFLTAIPAFGESSASVHLSGTVAPRSSLEVTSTNAMTVDGRSMVDGRFADTQADHPVLSVPLNFDAPGLPQIARLAGMGVSTNDPAGYTVTFSSGSMAATGKDTIAYRLATVARDAQAPASTDFVVPTGNDISYSTSTAGTEGRDLYLMYATDPGQTPGTYSGSISITISDN